MIYAPREDSFLLQKHVKKYAFGRTVLDMGTGSGILAEEALKYSDYVVAADINPKCIKRINEKFHGNDCIYAVQSDLFENVKGKFGLIIFNPPYLPEDKREDPESARATTGGKQGWEIIERFLKGAKNHLEKDGKILLLFSSLTNKEKVGKLIRENNFTFKQIDSEKLAFEELYVYLVF